ncbi:benzoate degradation ring-cleavage hydrolase [Labilithrix luteola]|uniref:Benzoate degradation ring-cleavage hydrolase n=1 Tax=Labilithrix luteola TaxID=1391654 RepID=A0A0K1PX04_9BACT|nr:alpha/beta hydrolase [Labilithrix luteola]AKU98058.1 benzoate degradation ring-cleavage hydrolase [Labilithrix luteola]
MIPDLRCFTLPSGRIEHFWSGPPPDPTGENPTLVFLHVGLGCAVQWRDFPATIAERTGLGALVYSRLGYGGSDPVSLPRPLSYMHDEAREELPRLLDVAGIRSAILVGHSDGGSIALIHAATSKGRVKKVVTLAPHVFVEDVSVTSIAEAKRAYEQGDLRARLAKYHANADVAFWGWNRAWLDPAFRSWNLEGFLPSIEVPVMVLQGEEDPYGTRAQVDAIAKGVSGPVETMLIPKCGHSPQRDQASFTAEAIVRFVR